MERRLWPDWIERVNFGTQSSRIQGVNGGKNKIYHNHPPASTKNTSTLQRPFITARLLSNITLNISTSSQHLNIPHLRASCQSTFLHSNISCTPPNQTYGSRASHSQHHKEDGQDLEASLPISSERMYGPQTLRAA